MPSLAQLLNAKITKDSLAVTAAAKKAGISFPSFYAALHGKSVPNARSVNKYASFLGISVADVQAASGKAAKPAKAAKGKMKKAKKAKDAAKGKMKKAKKAGRRGRPPGSKNKAAAKAAAKAAKAAAKVNRKALAALSASLKKATALLSKLA